jgi:hypothetical protein
MGQQSRRVDLHHRQVGLPAYEQRYDRDGGTRTRAFGMAHRRRDRLTTSRRGTSRTRTCKGCDTPPDLQSGALPFSHGSRATRMGVEPVTFWSTARHANRYTYGPGVGDGTCTRFSSATDWCLTPSATPTMGAEGFEPPKRQALLFYRQARLTIVAALPGNGEGGTRTHAPLARRTVFGTRVLGASGRPQRMVSTAPRSARLLPSSPQPQTDKQKAHYPRGQWAGVCLFQCEKNSVRRFSLSSPPAMIVITGVPRATGKPAVGIRPTHRRDKRPGIFRSLSEQMPGFSRS